MDLLKPSNSHVPSDYWVSSRCAHSVLQHGGHVAFSGIWHFPLTKLHVLLHKYVPAQIKISMHPTYLFLLVRLNNTCSDFLVFFPQICEADKRCTTLSAVGGGPFLPCSDVAPLTIVTDGGCSVVALVVPSPLLRICGSLLRRSDIHTVPMM